MARRARRRQLADETLWPSDPHTMVKHLAYRRYVQCWMGKILQTFQRAAIVDAFAGPGEYADGLDGSPVLVAKEYLNHTAISRFGRLHLLCLEERPDRVAHLERRRAELPASGGLWFDVRPPGLFADGCSELRRRAHDQDSGRPVLWLLDPFDVSSVSMDQLAICLAGTRDEVILTFFVDEMYRFAGKNPNMGPAMTRLFGSGCWEAATNRGTEASTKDALVKQFRETLQRRCGVLTGEFGVCVKNATARYYLVFATHDEHGMNCWNQMVWKWDPAAGRAASAASAGQPDLFGEPVTDRLRREFEGTESGEVRFDQLVSRATRLGFTKPHVRQVLTAMARDGVAFRVEPLDARTSWPEGCGVRFYALDDAADQ
jgi:three-Cys-motif partner protein